MTDEKKYTMRDMVLAQRDAYARGLGEETQYWGDDAVAKAHREYPLPKVTRPRVVSDGTMEWKYENELLMCRYSGWDVWRSVQYSEVPLNRRRAEALADLLANPTEEVEA